MNSRIGVRGGDISISDLAIGDLIAASEAGAIKKAFQPGRRASKQFTKKRATQASLIAPLLAAQGCLTVGGDGDVPLDSTVGGSTGGAGGATGQFAQDDIGFNVNMGSEIQIAATDLLENDIAAQGETLQLVRVFGASNGTVSMSGGVITFTPNPGYTGPATFSYEVQNSSGVRSQAEVELNVNHPSSHSGHGGSHSGHMATHDASMMAEHQALMDLVDPADATHVAINDGSWFDPGTWQGGVVPGAGARVLISDGVTVTYDGESPVSLFTVRVDGALEFATDVDTFMEVDTLVVSTTGRLEIGTIANPVDAGVEAIIQIADNGPIDTSWDPMLLSRGIISHGIVDIHGAEKEAFLKVATDPMAGDTSITLESVPDGWEVGDQIVLTGTKLQDLPYASAGTQRNVVTEDEELIITGISGNTITFATPLQFDHDTPRADLKAYVANYSRNVQVRTENADSVPVSERGHVMFMHSDAIDVRYAEFFELGRTDKSERAFDFDDLSTVNHDSNLKGRYSLHIHRAGVDHLNDPAMLVGNSVWGSPGWGFVHHDSNAILADNAAYNVFGAAFVAETGNETGRWAHNIAIKSIGVGGLAKEGSDVDAFDLGRTGAGFWFQGRMVNAVDNVAAGIPGGHGFVYMSRGDGVIDIVPDNLPQSEILKYLDSAIINHAPIAQFQGNESFATSLGVEVIKAQPLQEHDVRSVIDGFTAWEVQTGLRLEYTGHYTLKDIDLIAARNSNGNGAEFRGIAFGPNTVDVTVNGAVIDGFEVGIRASKSIVNFPEFDGDYRFAFVDVNHIGNDQNWQNISGAAGDLITSSSALSSAPFSFVSDVTGFPLAPAANNVPNSAKTELSGTKTDGLGSTQVSPDWDPIIFDYWSLRGAIEDEGHWTLPDGRSIALYEQYVSDRLTGEIYKHGVFVENPVADLSVAGGFVRTPTTYNGILDVSSGAPVGRTDFATVDENSSIVIDVLANDFDPDGDTISLDGFINAGHGSVFDNGDGTVTYMPDPNYFGSDSFWYWVEDTNGNFDKVQVQITVDMI